MKIIVLNGSPKGSISVTVQYVLFIQKKFPQHELKIINISQEIRKIERDEKAFQGIIDEVESSDGVLWAFPLYLQLVPSQYKRFIELIWERGAENAFKDRYTAVLSTSIHFYDHSAHNYMNAICDDLGMKYAGSFSADIVDLLKEEERDNLILFAEHFFKAIENNVPTVKNFKPVTYGELSYIPGNVGRKIDIGSKKVVIVTDSEDGQTNLGRMIERFTKSFSKEVEVINLHDVDIKGGCLGCLQCGYDNTCSYGNKDGYTEFYNTKIKTADVLVFAGVIKDRYLSSRWKMFFDRSFFNGHVPTWTGKQVGFIISGPLSQIPNLRQILESWVQMEQASLVDFITDEYEDSAHIDALLQSLAERVVTFADENYIKPVTFLGVGGRKIFRDDIWGRLRFPFQADHKYYRKHGIYDFPQKDRKARITNTILILLTKIPKMRKEIYSKRMKEESIKPLQKVVEKQ
ncbi:MAG: NAD(P)H-dependent oxidoreductase [Dehalococcoidia bacterium]|nr:NAD(P)H-dependent oxidoreductase [Dehalococcoidia bacterium]